MTKFSGNNQEQIITLNDWALLSDQSKENFLKLSSGYDALQSALTEAQEENKYLKTWIPEYLDDRLSRGEQTEIREFIRGKIDLDKLPQWLVNIVEENKRYKLALEEIAEPIGWGRSSDGEEIVAGLQNIAQSTLNGGKNDI